MSSTKIFLIIMFVIWQNTNHIHNEKIFILNPASKLRAANVPSRNTLKRGTIGVVRIAKV